MDMSFATWLSELGMDDPALIHQCFDYHPDSFIATSMGINLPQENIIDPEIRPAKQLKVSTTIPTTTASTTTTPESWTARANSENMNSSSSSSSSRIISFGVSDTTKVEGQNKWHNGHVKPKDEPVTYYGSGVEAGLKEEEDGQVFVSQSLKEHTNSHGKRTFGSIGRTAAHAQEHVLAERKRREKLSERFIALSTLVPGLKKMDKASVLGDAIKYLKQLQERVKTLEEQTTKRTMESVVFVKKSQVVSDNYDGNISSSDENSDLESSRYPLPEIEVRLVDQNVLIRVHCEKTQGSLLKIVNEIEKLHLIPINSNSMVFADYALDITVITQMGKEFCMTADELVKHLKHSLH